MAMRRYGLIDKDPLDPRDYRISFGALRAAINNVDLRPWCPPVYDQGDMASCTANAIGVCVQYVGIKTGSNSFMPSRLFIYYNERKILGTTGRDSGAYIRDGMKSVATQGVCPESMWPYVRSKLKVCPPPSAYAEALKCRSGTYARVGQTAGQLEAALAAGFPVVFGTRVFLSFESSAVARTGMVPMPRRNEKCIGGHAMTIVGYNSADKLFIVRNSWGADWGDNGYCYMPYAYILDPRLTSDIWTISGLAVPPNTTITKPSLQKVDTPARLNLGQFIRIRLQPKTA